VPGILGIAMHTYLSWIAIGLSVFHAMILLFDSYYTYTVSNLLVPFTGPYEPLWVGLGTLGFYIMLLVSASFSWRKWMGYKFWRKLHYLSFVSYIMVTFHGIMAGTDSGNLGMNIIYWGSGLAVFFLTIYRILSAD
ncbi:MAG: ferric reductase-like transmembrane domain-containing protein, partial [Chloroflexota bacterium]